MSYSKRRAYLAAGPATTLLLAITLIGGNTADAIADPGSNEVSQLPADKGRPTVAADRPTLIAEHSPVAPFDSSAECAEPPKGKHHVFLLDASASMSAGNADATPWKRAVAVIEKVARDATPDDRFSIIKLAREPSSVVERVVADQAIKALRNQSPAISTADFKTGFERGVAAALADPRPAAVYMVTDLPSSLADDAPTIAEHRRRLAANATLQWIDVGVLDRPNVAVTSLKTRRDIPVPETVTWSASVTSFSSREHEVRWRLRERAQAPVLAEGELMLAPGETRKVVGHLPAPEGEFLTLSITPPDHFADDDSRTTLVARPARMLIVGDDKADAVKENAVKDSAAAAWRFAINPFEKPDVGSTIVTVPPTELAKQDLEQFDVVVLANCKTPDPEFITRLEAWARRGGGILFLLGSNTEVDLVNERFFRSGEGLLPARLLGVSEVESSFDVADADHPLNAVWKDASFLLKQARVFQHVRLEISRRKDVEKVLSLADGTPAMVAAPFGQGRVAVLNTSGAWSDLYRSAAQVILTLETTSYLASPRTSGESREFLPSAPVTILVPSGATSVTVRLPDGGSVEVAAAGKSTIEFQPTDQLGAYTATSSSSPDQPFRWTTNISPAESNPGRLTHAKLRELFPDWKLVAPGK